MNILYNNTQIKRQTCLHIKKHCSSSAPPISFLACYPGEKNVYHQTNNSLQYAYYPNEKIYHVNVHSRYYTQMALPHQTALPLQQQTALPLPQLLSNINDNIN